MNSAAAQARTSADTGEGRGAAEGVLEAQQRPGAPRIGQAVPREKTRRVDEDAHADHGGHGEEGARPQRKERAGGADGGGGRRPGFPPPVPNSGRR